MWARVLSVVVGLLGMTGCEGDLDPASLILGPRVIGARAVMAADTARAWPEPGDEARVEFLVVDVGPPPPLTWGFIACPLSERSFGIDECDGDPLGLALQLTPPDLSAGEDPVPHVDFTVPTDATEESAVLVIGAICFSGTPTMDFESTQPCEGEGAKGTLVAFVLPVGESGSQNTHPSLDALRLAGGEWTYAPPAEAELEGCRDRDDMPVIVAAGQLPERVTLVMSDESFESYEAQSGDPPEASVETEDVQVSLFATGGSLEGTYAFTSSSDPETSIAWEPPPAAELPEGGLLVRFHFVLRDGRAGLSVVSRALCVTP